LNAITHPRVARLSAERLASVDPGAPYAIYEAALIVETGLHRTMRALIVVALDAARQLERVMRRDGLERVEAERRIAAQAPLAQKLEAADYVIDNAGDLSCLETRVKEVHHQLLDRFRGESR
jgi:dephospho-CoA kinase